MKDPDKAKRNGPADRRKAEKPAPDDLGKPPAIYRLLQKLPLLPLRRQRP